VTGFVLPIEESNFGMCEYQTPTFSIASENGENPEETIWIVLTSINSALITMLHGDADFDYIPLPVECN
jgi:hypothetical protein